MIAFFIPSLRSVASAIDFALLSLFALFAVARFWAVTLLIF